MKPSPLPELVVAVATVFLVTQVQGFFYPEQVPAVPLQDKTFLSQGPAPSENFTFRERLTDDYTLYWDFNDTHITFEVVVKTKGNNMHSLR
ncbi:DBH-like monooxygenase protein 1-like protein [Elysia marginata]|uniref:DBH-like monooxygenase protein 1-like protein n=1 Tax=Elysia marginata TaxID=1093978 RepID=A0AAV4EP69_9GAST|nr:DBH-like monooxygenase protein 1-like protein [Elysia marginata]